MKKISRRFRYYRKLAQIVCVMPTVILCGCVETSPPTGASSPSGVQWHGNLQNAGIYGSLYWRGSLQGFLVDDEYVTDYNLVTQPDKTRPLTPFSPITHPFPQYAIWFNVNGGPVIKEPLPTFLASGMWPANFRPTTMASAEAASEYETMLRSTRTP